MADQAIETHHWPLAHARAVQTYRSLAIAGEVGITLSIHPAYPADNTDADRAAARIIDGLHNRWFLDPTADPAVPTLGVLTLPNTDEQPAFNGPVYPEGLYDLLTRIDADYDHPTMYITENGAGFGPGDDALVDGAVKDTLRQDYITRHLEQANRAIADGVDLRGYFVWSCFDNFEWVFGYANRFGLIHVDFDTQQRTWKDSAHMYQRYIQDNGF